VGRHGVCLVDDFDPIAFEGLSFTLPWAETLFWSIASSLTAPAFGTGLIGGVLAGAVLGGVSCRAGLPGKGSKARRRWAGRFRARH
jgi:hypothetical protein